MLGLCVGDREARADCQCGELIDPIALRIFSCFWSRNCKATPRGTTICFWKPCNKIDLPQGITPATRGRRDLA